MLSNTKSFNEIDSDNFEQNFLSYFKKDNLDYTYLVSLTLCIKESIKYYV